MLSMPGGQMSLPGGHAAVCQVNLLDTVTIRIHLYLYTCIQFRIVSIPYPIQ